MNLEKKEILSNLSEVFEEIFPSVFGSPVIWNKSNFLSNLANEKVIEDENEWKIEIVAPKADKANFKVEVVKDELTVSYEKKEEVEKGFSLESFEEIFTIPENVDIDNFKSEYKDGILYIYAPKKEITTVNTRIIEIQ